MLPQRYEAFWTGPEMPGVSSGLARFINIVIKLVILARITTQDEM